MNTLELAKHKRNLLKEIGDTSPYYSEKVIDDEDHRVYNFETNSTPPTYYEVELSELEPHQFKVYKIGSGVTLAINFGVTDDQGIKSTKKLTNKGELYKVMATVADIVKKDIKEHPYINTLEFTPSKRQDKDTEESNARENLYKKYIEMNFKGADISKDNSNDTITVKLNSLKEIGDTANVETYTYSKTPELETYDEEVYKMEFTTESDTNYVVIINKIDRNEDNVWRMDIEFGVENESEGGFPASYDFKSVVNKGEMYKVMATVVKAVKKEIEDSTKKGQNIVKVIIEPSKNFENDTRRANLYMAYIQKNMPKGSKVQVSKDLRQIEIDLKTK